MSIKKQYSTETYEGDVFDIVIEKNGLVITGVTILKGDQVISTLLANAHYLVQELDEVLKRVDTDYELNKKNAEPTTKGGEPQ